LNVGHVALIDYKQFCGFSGAAPDAKLVQRIEQIDVNHVQARA